MKYRFLIVAALLAGFAFGFSLNASAKSKFINIGTGGVTGVYYPAGGAICRLVNRGRRNHGIRCSLESTGGSIYNLNSLRTGELDLAVAQSDWQYHAYNGTRMFKDFGQDKKLRSLFSLHNEPFTVIARKELGISEFNEIKGKRVNIGYPGSGMRATMDMLMETKGWTNKDFKLAAELKPAEQAQALCDNKIDVMIYAAGHPNGAVQEVATSCDATILEVFDEDIQEMIASHPFYSASIVPGGMYIGNDKDVKTFGVSATFVASGNLDEDVVYEVVKAVFDNFDNFRTLHPVFASLDKNEMVNSGMTAPLHRGAKKYFIEKGLLANSEEQAEKTAEITE